MKVNLSTTKNEESVLKSIQMAISIKESFKTTKSTAKESFIGSAFPLGAQQKSSPMMENGGVVFLMVSVCILVPMAIITREGLKMA